jgi:hypothetical protein
MSKFIVQNEKGRQGGRAFEVFQEKILVELPGKSENQ